MAQPENPGLVPYHAEAVVTSLPTVSRDSGYVPATIADPNVANALGQAAGRYIQYLDAGRIAVADLVKDLPYLVRGESLEWPIASGLGPFTPTQLPTLYAFGCRVYYSNAIFTVAGLSPYTFTPSKVTYFYGNSPTLGVDQIVQVDVLNLGAPPAPPPGFGLLGGVETDATDVTVLIASDVSTTIEIDAELLFSVLLASQAVIDASALTLVNALDVTGTGDQTALVVDGSGGACITATTADAPVGTLINSSALLTTLGVANAVVNGPALTVTSGSTLLQGDLTVIGTDATDALTVRALTTLSADVTLNADLTGGTTRKIGAGTLDTGTNGVLLVNNARYYTDVSPDVTDGAVSFDGHAHRQGDGSAATPFWAPRVSYKDTASTGVPSSDIAGCSVTLDIPGNRAVLITLVGRQSVNAIGAEPQFLISASNGVDNIAIIKSGDPDQAASSLPIAVTAGDSRPNRIDIEWKPTDDFPVPNNSNWTIQAKHGAIAGVVTTVGATLRVTYQP